MTDSMETIKAFVRVDNTVTIVCPACKMPKNANVASFRKKTHYLKVRCPCENVFRVHLDFRRHYRKDTDLLGMYKAISPSGTGGSIQINDISQSGLGFTVEGTHFIEKDHTLLISFELDDKRKTKLEKKVIVQSVDGVFIGCQFIEEQAYSKELGFYLTS